MGVRVVTVVLRVRSFGSIVDFSWAWGPVDEEHGVDHPEDSEHVLDGVFPVFGVCLSRGRRQLSVSSPRDLFVVVPMIPSMDPSIDLEVFPATESPAEHETFLLIFS